jgi:O-antigen/teichoic acid export membrane protein
LETPDIQKYPLLFLKMPFDEFKMRLLNKTDFGRLKFIRGGSSFMRGVKITLVAQVAMIAVNACTGIFTARLLGPKGRGELAVVIVWSFTLVYLVSCGVNQSIVYFIGKARERVSEVITAVCVIGAAQSIIVVAAGMCVLPIALRKYTPQVQHLALIFLAVTPLIIFGGYPGNVLQGLLRFRSFNIIRILPVGFYAAGLAVLALSRSSRLSSVIACQMIGLALALIVGCWILWHQVRPRWTWSPSMCGSLVRFGAKTQLGNISGFINRYSDQLILSLFVPPRELGLYVVAVTVSSAIVFLPQALGIATLAQAANEKKNEAEAIIGHASRLSLLWLGGVALFLFIFTPTLITHVFGSGYGMASLACRILLPGSIALGLNEVLYEGACALGYPALPSYAELTSTGITILVLFALVPRIGFAGAAVASSAAYISSCLLMLFFYHTRMQIDIRALFRFGVTKHGERAVTKIEASEYSQ